MREIFQGFINVDNIFWGDDVYRWWFYITIVLILFFEKRKSTKIVLAWFSIAFLFALFNPISNWVMSLIEPAWQYRARLYSMLPIPYVLALGTILLLDKICTSHRNELKQNDNIEQRWSSIAKMVMVGSVCVIIVLRGTDVYQQDWMRPAYNLEKVPKAVLELKEMLGEKEETCIAVPDSLSSYIRQVAPKLYTPYGRVVDELGAAISQEHPDPVNVMRKAGEESCDYIVVYDNIVNETSFQNNGYEVYAYVTGYAVYKVSGVPTIKKRHNEKRQVLSIISLDEYGHPLINNEGYAEVKYEYDQAGNRYKESYLDAEGNACVLNQGYASITRNYTTYSHQVQSETFLDKENNPVLINGRFITHYEYDVKRRLVKETYHDASGQLMDRADVHYASKQIKYDNLGRIICENYVDKNGKPVTIAAGYAQICWEYNEANQKIRETYWDTEDKPTILSNGYHGIVWEYEIDQNAITEKYIDQDGVDTNRKDGYSKVWKEYNEKHQLIREKSYVHNAKEIGFAILSRQFDLKGNIVEESYLDIESNPIKWVSGYASCKREYDEDNRIIREEYFDEEGNLIRNNSNYAVVCRTYDSNGCLTKEEYFDENNMPVLLSMHYASIIKEYDDYGDLVRESYQDENGERISCIYGFDEMIRTYSDRRLLREEYHTNGNLINRIDTWYAVRVLNYDEQGNVIKETFLDNTEKLVNNNLGYATIIREYNETGQLTSEKYESVDNP